MAAHTPEELYQQFRAAVSQGPAGLDALVTLYEPEATFVPRPGEMVTGTEAIRRALAGLLDSRPKITVLAKKVVAAGDIVLSCNRWEMKAAGPDGNPIVITGMGTEVARRQSDGTWLFLIDNPYGAE
jgi:ketosteroid isomerase-like protein